MSSEKTTKTTTKTLTSKGAAANTSVAALTPITGEIDESFLKASTKHEMKDEHRRAFCWIMSKWAEIHAFYPPEGARVVFTAAEQLRPPCVDVEYVWNEGVIQLNRKPSVPHFIWGRDRKIAAFVIKFMDDERLRQMCRLLKGSKSTIVGYCLL